MFLNQVLVNTAPLCLIAQNVRVASSCALPLPTYLLSCSSCSSAWANLDSKGSDDHLLASWNWPSSSPRRSGAPGPAAPAAAAHSLPWLRNCAQLTVLWSVILPVAVARTVTVESQRGRWEVMPEPPITK